MSSVEDVAVPEADLARIRPPDDSQLVESDGENIDSPWHRAAIGLLIESLAHHWRDRDDFFVGGNMFVYFDAEQVRGRNFRGPDFFVVRDVPRERPRRWWAVWSEGGRYPDLVIELLSPSTAAEDRTTKRAIYEQVWRTPEYFLHDPDTGQTEGWRLPGRNGHYEPIAPSDRGWFWSNVLQLWIGTWDGPFAEVIEPARWPRFYTPTGQLVLTAAEDNQARAEAEHQRAEAERQRADAERQRADAERQRADAAEAELVRLRALLSGGGTTPQDPPTP
jgi:Uma2 family endonuclease